MTKGKDENDRGGGWYVNRLIQNMANWNFQQDHFDRLLSWLNPDRERAGEHYESIRRKLILIFASRGWAFPEEMADDRINRVIRKLPEIEGQYQGPPEAYFYGVAKIIELEWKRKDRPIEIPDMEGISPETEEHLACLDRCLGKLPDASREVVMEYYQQEKQAKIDHRAALARRLGIAANALRIRAHRIRQQLEKCVLECLGERGLA
jgi:DNA-directed RNA polymerase specialized sigma24 family protein